MAATQKFVREAKPETWRNVFAKYEQVLRKKAEKKTKPQAKKDLITLDAWYVLRVLKVTPQETGV